MYKNFIENQKIQKEMAEKYHGDEKFRAKADQDPKILLGLGNQVETAGDSKVELVKNDESTFHFVLPLSSDQELSEDQLASLAAAKSDLPTETVNDKFYTTTPDGKKWRVNGHGQIFGTVSYTQVNDNYDTISGRISVLDFRGRYGTNVY